MKKDKEWLKKKMIYLKEAVGKPAVNDFSRGLNGAYDTLELLIDQLDEPEQVVIPEFAADFITEIKPNFNIRTVFTLQNNKHEQGQEWALGNPDVFARAWLDGYTIEKEKLYKVLLPGVESLDRQMCMHEETKVIGFASDGYNSRKYSKDDEFIRLFTEQEIKAIDERYWIFREEVEV